MYPTHQGSHFGINYYFQTENWILDYSRYSCCYINTFSSFRQKSNVVYRFYTRSHIIREWKTLSFFLYFRFPLLRTVVGSLQTSPLYRQISFTFFSPFCPKLPSSFFFLFWHLTLYGRLPKILAPKFAKYVLSSSIVLISVFGHVVRLERRPQFSDFLYLQQ